MILDDLEVPVVLAPLAGGPSTPELAAAVSRAGGLGFLAAGYLTADELGRRVRRARELAGAAPLGVNLFVPGGPAGAEAAAAVAGYAGGLAGEAQAAGAEPGEPRFDDDDWTAKLARLAADPVPVVSFTFGCPEPDALARLRAAGSETWVTVSTPADAATAAAAGADVLVAQGAEAGGHRSVFRDDPAGDLTDGIGLLALLALVRARTARPVVAAGGIMTGAGIAAVLAAGAAAAQLGTAFLRCPEAGTAAAARTALAGHAPTAMTRAFTGRLARGIRNRFLDEHTAAAPAAYPEVHYVTAPLRAAGRAAGDAGVLNLWAGQAYELGRELPAGELTAALGRDAARALRDAAARCAPAGRGAGTAGA
jgi:nitronate monooxygenase